ncbi:GNAT family N-acetyltransferase [Nocardioides sp. B-3]|nr:GNAT family N-acetyltransferase [Nocardioides sp. B-3]UUZ57729.1 GNAT family N-acetyltransferase [Nocardioides sp. B-3]
MTRSAPRPLEAGDLPQIPALSREAFGDFPTPPPSDYPPPGRHNWGTFAGNVLAAKVTGRTYHSWFHGREVATNGIASVAVAAEHRGAGLLDDLMTAVLEEGLRERGEVISTLFPTAPGIYRRYGYELISSYDAVEIPTARPASVPKPEATTVTARSGRRLRCRPPHLRDVGRRPERAVDPHGRILPRRRRCLPRRLHRGHRRGGGRAGRRLRNVAPRHRLRLERDRRDRRSRRPHPRRHPRPVAGLRVVRVGRWARPTAHLRSRLRPSGAALRRLARGFQPSLHAARARRRRCLLGPGAESLDRLLRRR